MSATATSPETSPEPSTAVRFCVPLSALHFPPRCARCGSNMKATVHVTGGSQREPTVLIAMLCLGIAALIAFSMNYPRPEFAALGVLSIVAELAVIDLLVYGILLRPVLALYRRSKRDFGIAGSILLGAPAGFLWVCMAFSGANLGEMSDIGLIAGWYLTALFAIHVNCQLHLDLPACDGCRKLAASSVEVVDYFPLRRKALLEFRNQEYAEAFAQENPAARDCSEAP